MNIAIRLARRSELNWLETIEIDATSALVEAGVPFPNGIHATPRHLLEAALSESLLFVATDEDDRPIGFLAAHERDNGLYVGEIDVLRNWQHRGIGRALMRKAIDEARTRKLWGAMLTTERFIPFNAPFYATLGFREVSDAAVPPALAQVLATDVSNGVDPSRRVGMVLRFAPD